MKFPFSKSVEKCILFQPERFSHQSLKSITAHGGKRSSRNRKSRANAWQFAFVNLDRALYQFALQKTAMLPYLVDDSAPPKALPLFHRRGFLTLVADGKFLSSFCSPAGENAAAVLRGHPRSKSMSIPSFPSMRLKCPFQSVTS